MLRVSPAHIACVSLVLHDIVACTIDATSYGHEGDAFKLVLRAKPPRWT